MNKKNHYRRRRSWRSIVTTLAAIVVFCTTYALILPAITMERHPTCGVEEHTHVEMCYTSRMALSCTVSEPYVHTHDTACYLESGELLCALAEIQAHSHTEECYTVEPTVHEHEPGCFTPERGGLICILEEGEGHIHAAGCYTEQTVLICEMIESEGHIHGEGCRDEEGNLTCNQEESEGHTHGENCWNAEAALICQQEESAGHTHLDECYVWNDVLICEVSAEETVLSGPVQTCTLEEIVLHTHDDDCYGEDGSLICGQPQIEAHVHSEACLTAGEEILSCTQEEHIHDPVLCYIDNEADVETEQEWVDTLPQRLSGVWADDLLAVAESQLGYCESEYNVQVDAEGFIRGYTRYGAWYGSPYSDWNSIFVSFCLNYAGIDRERFAYESDAGRWITVLTAREQYVSAGTYTPVPGDLVFMDLDDNGNADTVAIVKSLEGSRLTVIQGDTENRSVEKIGYLLSDTPMETQEKVLLPGDLLGYGILPENPNPDGAEETTEAAETTEATEPQTVYNCGMEEHNHKDTCYDADGNVICEQTEHTHTEKCEAAALSERVENVISLIDALPTADEVDETLRSYEEAEDWDGYEAYFRQISNQAAGTYVFYEDLSEAERAEVTNADKLLELEWLWSARTLEITQGIPVYQINSYGSSEATGSQASVLFYGKSADDYGVSAMDFSWWSAIIVDVDAEGRPYVSDLITTGGVDKSTYAPQTESGFVLMVWHDAVAIEDLNIKVGDYVSIPIEDYSGIYAYTGTSYGTITFASGGFKADKDNTGKLSTAGAASTRDFIVLNLYDYSTNINYLWNSVDKKYPGFQQDYGTTTASLSKFGMNFGNNITSDYAAGESGITTANGANINATWDNGYGLANVPIEGMVSATLLNDYPALSDGTSLKYLFADNSGYATKQNTLSIDGLFQIDPESGEYFFNSRENHAQFNPGSDTFTLYNQVISSNFIMYPFGNFLPFNDIVHQSAQTSTIDRAYLQTIADSAQYKVNGGASSEYQILAAELDDFIALMDEEYGINWASADAMNEYFTAAGIGKTFNQSDALLEKVYSIDFDEPTNFFFGMEMKMNFMQPKNGMTGNDKNGNGISDDFPMIFYFTGDDDVWVYIDGVLFLDLSGIHRHVGGKIDFVNGEVSYYALDVSTGDVATVPYKTVKFVDILGSTAGLNEKGTFEDYSTHSFNFYYMERGAGSGVCRLNFNFPLLRQNSISVSKAVEADTAILGDPGYKFQVLKADSDGNKLDELFIAAGTAYTIHDEQDNVIGTGATDANGVFTLKAGQRAEFAGITENAGKYYVRELLDGTILEQYGSVTVSGESTTTSGNVTIGSDTFTGMDSPVKDMSDGATAFRFTNDVEEEKLATLSIAKELSGYSDSTGKTFDIEVTLDDEKLPVGMSYEVAGENRTVQTEGIVTIAAGEQAVISNILAGTRFTVKETSESADGYIVTYTTADGYSVEQAEGGVSGVMTASAAVQLVVNNSEKGAKVTIPLSKAMSKSDGTAREYTFHLVEAADSTGTGVVGSTDYPLKLSVAGETVTGEFSLVYKLDENQTLPLTHYYRITEETGEDTLPNGTTYVVEVTLSKTMDGNISADITGIWKDGEEYEGGTLAYTNTLFGSLTLSKTVSGIDTDQGFRFTIQLDPGTSGLTDLPDTYPAVFYQQDGTEEETAVRLNSANQIVLEGFKDGQKAVITGIPYGVKWTITEESADGFKTTWTGTGGAEQTSGEGTTSGGSIVLGDTEVAYINTAMYELPETGGAGTQMYTMGGLLLMLSAGVLLLYSQRRRGKEDF